MNAILRYVRRGRVLTVATLKGIDAEAIEFKVDASAKVCGTPLKELAFPKDGVIGTIIRGSKIIIPRGNDRVIAGDDVIVFALPHAIPEIEKLFG